MGLVEKLNEREKKLAELEKTDYMLLNGVRMDQKKSSCFPERTTSGFRTWN